MTINGLLERHCWSIMLLVMAIVNVVPMTSHWVDGMNCWVTRAESRVNVVRWNCAVCEHVLLTAGLPFFFFLALYCTHAHTTQHSCFNVTRIPLCFLVVNVQPVKTCDPAMVGDSSTFGVLCHWFVLAVLAAASIANIVKSSLGPVGLDKMLVDEIGVSNLETRLSCHLMTRLYTTGCHHQQRWRDYSSAFGSGTSCRQGACRVGSTAGPWSWRRHNICSSHCSRAFEACQRVGQEQDSSYYYHYWLSFGIQGGMQVYCWSNGCQGG